MLPFKPINMFWSNPFHCSTTFMFRVVVPAEEEHPENDAATTVWEWFVPSDVRC